MTMLAAALAFGAALLAAPQEPEDPPPRIDAGTLRHAATVAGVEFEAEELEMSVRTARQRLQAYTQMRAHELANSVPPATSFVPPFEPKRIADPDTAQTDTAEIPLPAVERPADLEALGFADIRTLASLVKSRQVSCLELTDLFLDRLARADQTLHCVVTAMPERAREQARKLDALLDAGTWLGPLHGIPYGAKDLLAARGAPTTWGAAPFRAQVLDEDAAVIEHLESRGAVLCAKLTLGALAMGDVWFGGTTRNPWNPEQGSSGSSAGSAAAVAAGALPFAIGSETLGSIVSPSTRCGCSSLRPTFGVVDTRGAMALSWTMDKLGPLCRSADDVALVFHGMLGGATPTGYRFGPTVDVPARGMRIGYDAAAFERAEADRAVLEELRALEVELVPIELPDYPVRAMLVILHAEAATAFDELTRSNRDAELTRQGPGAWPDSFRSARFIPAVEYLRAQRLRTLLIRDTVAALAGVDAYVHPTFRGRSLTTTNLTGHPTFVAPFGEQADGSPRSICFTGQLYGEAALLRIAQAWQSTTGHHARHPEVLR